MDIEAQRVDLLKSLALGQSVIEKRTTVPSLNHVYLKAENGQLHLSFTNLDMELSISMTTKIQKEGDICVPGEVFYEIIKKLKNEKVSVSFKSDTLQVEIKSGSSTFLLSTLPASDFPHIEGFEPTSRFSIPSDQLQFLIDQTRFSMCENTTQYTLGGIYFHMVQDGLRAVSTDTHRLSCAQKNVHIDAMFEGMILGKKTIFEIRKLLDESKKDALLLIGYGRIELKVQTSFADISFSSRLIEGKFPDYEETLQNPLKYHMIVPTKDLLDAVDRMSTILDKDRGICLKIKENQLLIKALNNKMGTAEDSIDMHFPHQHQQDIFLNSSYLLDALKHIHSDETKIEFSSDNEPILITPVQDHPEEQYLLMPLID